MKSNTIRILIIMLLTATFAIIFYFSSQMGEKSDGVSQGIIKKIIETVPSTKNLNEQEKQNLVQKWNPIIRKFAHFGVYTLAGILIMSFMSTFKISLSKRIAVSIAICVVYAILDEYHQSFVADRSPSIIDVGIDSLGVLTGICIVLTAICILKKTIFEEKNSLSS